MRIRSKMAANLYEIVFDDGRPSGKYPGESTCEVFTESRYPGSNQCYHWAIKGPVGRLRWQRNSNAEFTSYLTGGFDDLTDVRATQFVESCHTFLEWDKLPTSSKFGIIQILAELDETLLLLTKKFWLSLSYGSFTWGVLPLISDINSILTTIKRIASDVDGYELYEDVNEFTDSKPVTGLGTQAYDLKVTTRFTGKVRFDISNLPALLDVVGFHPDIATAWDLIPLSFVLDYFIPVGDFLDKFSRGGWVNYLHFDGWLTKKVFATYSYSTRAPYPPDSWVGPLGVLNHQKEIFYRWRCSMPFVVDREEFQWDLEIPSLKNLFNTFYIFVLSRRGL